MTAMEDKRLLEIEVALVACRREASRRGLDWRNQKVSAIGSIASRGLIDAIGAADSLGLNARTATLSNVAEMRRVLSTRVDADALTAIYRDKFNWRVDGSEPATNEATNEATGEATGEAGWDARVGVNEAPHRQRQTIRDADGVRIARHGDHVFTRRMGSGRMVVHLHGGVTSPNVSTDIALQRLQDELGRIEAALGEGSLGEGDLGEGDLGEEGLSEGNLGGGDPMRSGSTKSDLKTNGVTNKGSAGSAAKAAWSVRAIIPAGPVFWRHAARKGVLVFGGWVLCPEGWTPFCLSPRDADHLDESVMIQPDTVDPVRLAMDVIAPLMFDQPGMVDSLYTLQALFDARGGRPGVARSTTHMSVSDPATGWSNLIRRAVFADGG